MNYKGFEEALSRMEAIVGELEKGELALEDALKLFEEGVSISHFCSEKLEEAERRVEILLRDNRGKVREEPFQLQGEPE